MLGDEISAGRPTWVNYFFGRIVDDVEIGLEFLGNFIGEGLPNSIQKIHREIQIRTHHIFVEAW